MVHQLYSTASNGISQRLASFLSFLDLLQISWASLMDYDIYREEFAIKYPTYGHALWEPSPGGHYTAVEIGDVGFIREGRFHRLFNTLLSRDHPSHEDGVPQRHEPLVLSLRSPIDNSMLWPNDLRSNGVLDRSEERRQGAREPDEATQVSFSCSRRRGAILSLPMPAQRKDTRARKAFAKCIIKHIDEWFAFAQECDLGISREDIILVTGCHMTKTWATIAFRQEGEQVSFGVRVSGVSDAMWQFTREGAQGVAYNLGPSGQDLPENQCIFIRGFRVTRFSMILPRLRGAAGPSQPPDEDEPNPDAQVESIPNETRYQDPLRTVLEYVATAAPECDMALVHDDDLQYVDTASLKSLRPDTVMSYLRKFAPKIRQFSCEISPTSHGGKGKSKSEQITVAVLSNLESDIAHELKPVTARNTIQERVASPITGYRGHRKILAPSFSQDIIQTMFLNAVKKHFSSPYGQYDRELRSCLAAALSPNPPAPRQNVPYMEPLRSTPPSLVKQSPTGLSVKARMSDKSLPVQEEFEEDEAYEHRAQQELERDWWTPDGSEYGRHSEIHDQEVRDLRVSQHQTTSSPTPSPNLLPEGFDTRHDARPERNGRENYIQIQQRKSDDAQQRHDDDDEDIQYSGRTQSQDEESYTPRSPSVALLPECGAGPRDSPGHLQQRQHPQHPQQGHPQSPRIRSRNGVTDVLGRSFDATSFKNTIQQLESPQPEQNHRPYPVPQTNSPRQIHSSSHEDNDHLLDDLDAHYHGYLQSPMATHPRPGAPFPPIPCSNTAAPSPSPLISGMGRANRHKPVLPPYSPAPPVGSPYPYPYGHIRRGKTYSGSYNGTMDFSQMDSNVVREQLALQMQIYALNNGGMVSDSTLSPSSTPFPESQYNPWAFLQTSNVFGGRRGGILDSTASVRSSPSHQPISLPPHVLPGQGLRRRGRFKDLRHRARLRPPPHVDSTQPRDTSPELSSGEETAEESKVGELQSQPRHHASRLARRNTCADNEDEENGDDEEWVDEDIGIEGVTDDLLQSEFHTDYVSNPEKRRRRWKVRWEALLRAFHALDRETDTTLVLLAAPSHSSKFHSVASRAIRRDVELLESSDIVNMRTAFAEVAARRRASRSVSLIEQLSSASSPPGDGSPSSSSVTREEDLWGSLDTVIGSLRALGSLYEQQEMRWIEEKHRLDEDKEKVQLLLRQALGVGVVGNIVETAL